MDLGSDAHVWRAHLEVSEAELDRLVGFLAADEQQRSERFYFDRDRRRFIAARGWLRALLSRYSGVSAARLAFVYGPQGKPALPPGSGLEFNVSHSRDLALFAFARGTAVGVDVEHIRADVNYATIAGRFFSHNEAAALERVADSLRQEAFFACWTRKEAYIKALGGGLAVPLDRFDVSLDPGEPARLLDDRGKPDAPRIWALHDIDAGPGFRAALALKRPDAQIRLFECSPIR